ncbi:YceD family protein [Roseobacter sp. EG26]|uniref:YceD family protein n=1 Tax=Roseobacter sp. EG26 TaxID=3412477 RepID=UPI003CE491E2
MSKQIPPSPSALRVAELKQNSATGFAMRPDSAELKKLAGELDLLGLRKLSFSGEVVAQGSVDWRLNGVLGATVIQPCSVTLEPVTTRIDVPVERIFIKDYVEDDAPEVEMSQDDTIEPLGHWIDPDQIMREALVLALPLYPRSDGADAGELVYTKPGLTPMRDEDARPFAGLAALREQLDDTDKSDT